MMRLIHEDRREFLLEAHAHEVLGDDPQPRLR